jgi:hypothetical protein
MRFWEILPYRRPSADLYARLIAGDFTPALNTL